MKFKQNGNGPGESSEMIKNGPNMKAEETNNTNRFNSMPN